MNLYNYRESAILYVDDEPQSTELFKEYFSDVFEVDTANSAREGWELFRANPGRYGIVISDQRMPGESGVEFLEKVKNSRPKVLRILTTAYSDMDAAIQSVNTGAVYKYITKPWDPPTLEITLKRGMEFFIVQRERDQLMREKLSALQRLMMTDRLMSLGIFAAGLNHHLRNSLTAVKTFLDLAPVKLQSEQVNLEALRNPDYWNDFYTTVQGSMERVLGLLEEVGEIPEPPRQSLDEQVDVAKALDQAIAGEEETFKKRRIKVERTGESGQMVTGNGRIIARMLGLLVRDEALNMNEGGTLKASVDGVKMADGSPAVRAFLSDDGPGIKPEAFNCLFDPFFVRRNMPEQYGLNLLACFFLVHHHSGSIRVDPSGNGGVAFEILLPVKPPVGGAGDENQAFLRRVFEMEKVWEKKLIEG